MSLKDMINDDLSTIFSIDDFAEVAIIDGEEIPVIFYEKSEYLLDDGYLAYSPAILLKQDDAKKLQNATFVSVRDENYSILKKEFREDNVVKFYISKDAITKF